MCEKIKIMTLFAPPSSQEFEYAMYHFVRKAKIEEKLLYQLASDDTAHTATVMLCEYLNECITLRKGYQEELAIFALKLEPYFECEQSNLILKTKKATRECLLCGHLGSAFDPKTEVAPTCKICSIEKD